MKMKFFVSFLAAAIAVLMTVTLVHAGYCTISQGCTNSNTVAGAKTNFSIRGYDSAYTGDNAVYVKSDGNVGIGTTAPGSITEIQKASNAYWTPATNNWNGTAIPAQALTITNTQAGGYDAVILGRMKGATTIANTFAIGSIGEETWTDAAATQDSSIYFSNSENGALFERMRIKSNGNVGVGVLSPTGVLHLKAGTAAANTAPLKFTSGIGLTTPEAGAMEFDGTNLYFTPAAARKTVAFTDSNITGNAATASAFAADPSDCIGSTVATAIAANGNLTCGITPLVSGGTLTSLNICRYDGTGIDCDRSEDASGTCGANSVCMGGHTHPTTEISGVNAGTDLTADLEEEAHASEHAVAAADTVFPADPGADRYLMWDDDPGVLTWADLAGGGDITDIGDCTGPACFTGTSGTTLTFNNAGGDKTLAYDGTDFDFNAPLTVAGTITAGGNILPSTSDGAALGSSTKMFSDLFLASGGVINWNNGNMTLTHAAGTLTFAGGTVVLGTATAATSLTTPSIIATSNALTLKPTTDATTAIQLQDKDGNSILNVDTTNNRVGIGLTNPGLTLEVQDAGGSSNQGQIRARSTESSTYADFGISRAAAHYGLGLFLGGTQQAHFYGGGMSLGSKINTDPAAGGVLASGSILTSSTSGIGYTAGAGATVTQLTSKSTGVTINAACGTITMNNESLGGPGTVTFEVTNSSVAATDVVVAQYNSGGTAGAYVVTAYSPGAGTFRIAVRNVTAGALTEAIVIRFVVVKAVTS